ncbi:hypothetical protein KEM55_008046 [Ascosphaera atra]|nr:hypothetical protein KEM55_008046 [Ascosphaera atra]
MVLERLQQLSQQVDATAPLPHPFDPLSAIEIERASGIVRAENPNKKLIFNTITLSEPIKKEMLAWLANPEKAPRPLRAAEVVVILGDTGKAYDGIVDLVNGKVTKWVELDGEQPIITPDELLNIEFIARKNPEIIKQCGILGIPPEDMDKVYVDATNACSKL